MSLHKKEKKFLILLFYTQTLHSQNWKIVILSTRNSKRVAVKCFKKTDRCTVLVLSILFISVFNICIGILIFYVYTLIFS